MYINTRRKVLHIISNLSKSGAETVLYNLIRHGIQYDHVVISLTGEGYYGRLLNSIGIRTYYLNFNNGS